MCKKKEIVEPEQGRLEFSPAVFSIASYRKRCWRYVMIELSWLRQQKAELKANLA